MLVSMTTHEIKLPDDRTVVVHDAGPSPSGDELAVFWHHGSPQTGALLDPVLNAAAKRGIRVVSYARPSYGGSSPRVGRDVAAAAADVAAAADSLGLERFASIGASG